MNERELLKRLVESQDSRLGIADRVIAADRIAHEARALLAQPERGPLTFEQIEDCFPINSYMRPSGAVHITAQWLHDFARAIERAHGIE